MIHPYQKKIYGFDPDKKGGNWQYIVYGKFPVRCDIIFVRYGLKP